jgi:predicted transcriptional regulator
MTTKQEIIAAIQKLPDDATFEDAIERLLFLESIERGIKQADAGQVVSHEEAKRRLSKWLK